MDEEGRVLETNEMEIHVFKAAVEFFYEEDECLQVRER